MARSTASLWLLWAAMFATLLLWLVLPRYVPGRADPWYDAQTAVAAFVLVILALVGGVSSFAMREAIVREDASDGQIDLHTGAGIAQLRRRLFALWLVCAAVGSLGGLLGYYSNRADLAWPYVAGAAALFAIHAPRRGLLRQIESTADLRRAGLGGQR